MSEPLTPEERAACMAELKAEALREAEWEFDEEYLILMLQELEEKGGYSGDEMLVELLDGKPVFVPPWY
jgi:hypothetical protein